MGKRAWIVKITHDGTGLSTQVFDCERSAQCFLQRTAAALKDKCSCRILRHVIRIQEETFEDSPKHFPLKSSRREIVILEAVLTEKPEKTSE